ncbi:MAG: DUF3472 domain-containing protein [Fimbriimonas sp.]
MLTILALIHLAGELFLPANTGYFLSPSSARLTDAGLIEKWGDGQTAVLWGGWFAKPGRIQAVIDVNQGKDGVKYRLMVEGPKGAKSYRASAARPSVLGIDIAKPGWYKFTLSGLGANGADFGSLRGIRLVGDPTEGAKFNLKPRQNCASVHIGYPIKEGTEVEWFYNEVKAQTDPIYTYYMACGFSRGYFGMQVNSPTERRVIFSVWDSGNEAVDRNKVSDENRVKLLGKGANVVADSFGNEGTGGHSHIVMPWQTETRQRFLVHAEKDGNGTIYTGYYYAPVQKQWTLVASFRAPKDGGLLRGLYSFNENFGGENGHLKRAAEFGSAWIRTKDGQWAQLTTGRFTHDVTGGVDRFDYDMKVIGARFLLQNGGFEGSSPTRGTLYQAGKASPPNIDLASLPIPK